MVRARFGSGAPGNGCEAPGCEGEADAMAPERRARRVAEDLVGGRQQLFSQKATDCDKATLDLAFAIAILITIIATFSYLLLPSAS